MHSDLGGEVQGVRIPFILGVANLINLGHILPGTSGVELIGGLSSSCSEEFESLESTKGTTTFRKEGGRSIEEDTDGGTVCAKGIR